MRGPDLAFVGLAGAVAAMSFVVLADRAGRARSSATLDGLVLSVGTVQWLEDQMDHGLTFDMPASFRPDLPGPGSHRLSVEVALQNRVDTTRHFAAKDELALVSDAGGRWGVVHAEVPEIS